MSSPGLVDLLSKPKEKVKPQLPDVGAVQQTIQSGSPQPAPQIPSMAPPNVDGGDADFSAATSAIDMVIKSTTAQIAASKKALEANTAVSLSAATQIQPLEDNTIKSYENIQKINSLPGGASGKLAHIIGIFDSDYNAAYQETQGKINQLKAKQISDTAAAIKEQNNALPEVLKGVSAAANVIWTAQKDANDLFLKGETLKNQQLNTQIAARHLQIDLSQEARAAVDHQINGMTTDQLKAELPRAEAGKGPFAKLGGLLQARITQEQMAEVGLARAQIGLKKDDREEYNAGMIDAVSHFPTSFVKKQLAVAQAAGSSMVDMPVGTDPKTNKPIMGQVPFDLVNQGLLKSQAFELQVDTATAAEISERGNLIPNVQQLANVANAFARSGDTRFTQQAITLGHVMKNLDPNNPNSVRQTVLLTADMQKKQDEWVKEQANKYGTPEAKAAIISYGKQGKFDNVGGTAVVAESVGIPSLIVAGKFKTAWGMLGQDIASAIASQHIVNGPTIGVTTGDGSNSNADAMSLLAQVFAKPSGKETVNRLTQEYLADPLKVKKVRDAVTSNIRVSSVNSVLYGLAQDKNANPVWGELLEHPDEINEDVTDEDGKVIGTRPSVSKFFSRLEKETVISGGKLNYSALFLKGLQNFGLNADNSAASDPSYTTQDRALEASIFGANPSNIILSGMHYEWRGVAARAHAEMMKRIEQDKTGKTQRDAVMRANPLFEEYRQTGPSDNTLFATSSEEILKRTGVNLATVPSATGTGVTAEQIRRMYGGQ